MSGKKTILLLAVILIVASVLRFSGLDVQSLGNDELFSVNTSSSESISQAVMGGAVRDRHPPGYPAFLYAWIKYFGDSEYVLRFPSAVAGVVSVFLVFLIGLRLYSTSEALIAASLMAVLCNPVSISQWARMYSMLLAFSLTATYSWIVIVDTLNRKLPPSWVWVAVYCSTAAVSSYLHYFGLYFVGLQAVLAFTLFVRDFKRLAWVLLIYVCIALAFAPWMPVMWDHVLRSSADWHPATPMTIWRTFCSFFNLSPVFGGLAVCMYCFLGWHKYSKRHKKDDDNEVDKPFLDPDLLLFLWLVVPFLGAFLKSIFGNSILAGRYFIISMPAAYLLLARAACVAPLRQRNLFLAVTFLLTVFLVDLLFLRTYYSRPFRDQFREATKYVVEIRALPRGSLVFGLANSASCFDYYFRRLGSPLKVRPLAGGVRDLALVRSAVCDEKPDYLCFLWGNTHPEQGFVDFLRDRLTLVEHKEFRGAAVLLFRKVSCEDFAVNYPPPE